MASLGFCRSTAAALLVAASSSAVPAAAPVAAAALRDRPRLFVPIGKLEEVARRARGGLRGVYETVRRDCDEPLDARRVRFTLGNTHYLLARSLAFLLLSRLERGGGYRDKALELVEAILEGGPEKGRRDARVRLQVLAIAYDWLHDGLAPALRERLRSGIEERFAALSGALETEDELVSGHSHFTTASLAIAALALDDGGDASRARTARVLAHWGRYVGVARKVAADGGHHLGWRYGRSYAARLAWVSEAIATATGEDVFAAERPWLSQLGYHLAYGLRPDGTYFRVGDTHRRIAVNLEEDLVLLGILASRYRDPHLAWFAALVLERSSESRAYAADVEGVWALLFHDPGLRRAPPGDLPLARAFRGAGNYVMRTGWGPDDTVVLFRAMPWYHFNHERRDFGSFLIYRRGGLAVHGGAYLAGDDDTDYGGPHLANYAWRTAAHNTITVYDPDERFCRPAGPRKERCEGENRWSNDGGQMVRTTWDDEAPVPHFQPRNAAEIDDPRFEQGRVLAYEDRPEATYVLADGTRAYRPSKVRLFARHFFFLKKVAGWRHPVIVVFDEITAAKPGLKKAWLLHTVEPPRIEGRAATVLNTTRVRLAGDLEPKPRDPWFQYGGKLHVETLLPADARIDFVGGEGKEFWVDGTNYPAEVREADQVIEPGIGRIEVVPGAPREKDLFLHVLSPTEAEDPAPRPEARLLEGTAEAALRVGDVVLVVAPASQAAGAGREPLRYRADGARRLRHLVTRLAPSARHVVRRGGRVLARAESSAQGVLAFEGDGGAEIEVGRE
ncbi:MAG: heparinase II/III family protein [Planctomycetes bacterium]|nr:heparinase II/III family protein [Planctomycetota bacterium]